MEEKVVAELSPKELPEIAFFYSVVVAIFKGVINLSGADLPPLKIR